MGLVNAHPRSITDLGNQWTLHPPLETSVHPLLLIRGRFPLCSGDAQCDRLAKLSRFC